MIHPLDLAPPRPRNPEPIYAAEAVSEAWENSLAAVLIVALIIAALVLI